MATILAPGTDAAVSSNIVVAAGKSVVVGIYSTVAAGLPGFVSFQIVQATPGVDNVVATLYNHNRAVSLVGPATYRVKRIAYTGTPFGVFMDA